ncbi:ubiquitin carboxyl-terminal hydrolase 21-like [Syzygium oleosum]|uniref:ubiquitin carboxyl-terminal hydrolase 21-like n=1 Tax=Syzygium oleosum TaxID=219896 RepID=UPI0024BAAAEF|nr:ubiquitin carboxyl-terminal hydrolase 21-like [Syzygium oleosum]
MAELQPPETLDRPAPPGPLLPRRIPGGRGPSPPPAPGGDGESPDEMEADGGGGGGGGAFSPRAPDDGEGEKEVSPEENRYGCYRRPELSWWSPWCPRRRLICSPLLLPAPPVREIVPSGVGAGLNNLGFTCFLNAVLQCLTHTVPLVQAIRGFDHADPCDRGREGFCVLCVLRDHIELCISSSGRIISPFKLAHNLNNISSDFQRYQQEDAHEFQHALLDRLERCCLDSKAEDEMSTRSNVVDQVFGGRLVSKLQCCSCGHCSYTHEPLIDLSLEIEHADNLSAALESFTNVEKIEDPETKFRCSSCNQEVSMEKQLLLDKEPSVAVFHLKRFKTDGFNVEKIDKHMDFPLELDLQPYTGGSRDHNVEFKYQLYAIVVHIGISPTSGHYFSFVRSSPGTWHRFDDAEVQKVQEDLVLAQDAYLLFYTKQGTPWFSSLMEAQKPHLNPDLSDASPTSVLDNVDVPCTSSPGMTDTDKPICCEPSRVSDEDTASYPGNGSGNNGLGEVTGAAVATFPSFDHDLGKNEVVYDFGDDIAMFDAPLSSDERTCHVETSFSGRGESTTSFGEKVCEPESQGLVNNDVFRPLTPLRSPSRSPASPDTYARKSSGASDGNSHLLKPNRSTCKQQLSKALDDPKRREAIRYIRNMPSSRGLRFYHAVLGPQSPGASKKKIDRRRMRASPCKRTSPPSARPRSSHVHSVAARSR